MGKKPLELRAAFRAGLDCSCTCTDGAASEAVERLLQQAERAQARWPDVAQSAEAFLGYVAQRLPRDSDGRSAR